MADYNAEEIMVSVFSGFYDRPLKFPAFRNKRGDIVLSHWGLKKFALSAMKLSAKPNGRPITFSFRPVDTSLEHCVIDCTFSCGGYSVTESGEVTTRTLNTNIARDYPYLEAQKRAFDRAVVSFWQLELDGKRLHSDTEQGNAPE